MIKLRALNLVCGMFKAVKKLPSKNANPAHLADTINGLYAFCLCVIKAKHPNSTSQKDLDERANISLLQLMCGNEKKSDAATVDCIVKWCAVSPRLNVVVDSAAEVFGRKEELFNVLQNPERLKLAEKVKKVVAARDAMVAH